MMIVLLLITWFTIATLKIADGANFVEPTSDTKIWANDTDVSAGITGEAIFRWRYVMDNGDDDLRVRCGWLDGVTFQTFVQKIGHTNSPVVQNSLGNRLKVISNSTDNNVIELKLTGVKKTDASKYSCRMNFQKNGKTQWEENSKIIQLEVLDRPRFVNCLENLPTVKEDETMEISCSVVGNPRPKMMCILYNRDNVELLRYPSTFQELNVTKHSIRVQREADYITCFAEAARTGNLNKTAQVFVQTKPFSVTNFTQIASNEPASIRLQWNAPTSRDLGYSPLLEYWLIWWQSSSSSVKNTTKLGIPPRQSEFSADYYTKDGKVFYEMKNFDKLQVYSFTLRAINIAGSGDLSARVEATPGFAYEKTAKSSQSKNSTPIIIGVVCGVVGLVVLLIVVVWLVTRSKSKKKQYPTSYVEDAVDYPLQPEYEKNGGYNNDNTIPRSTISENYKNELMENDPGAKSKSYENSNKSYV